MQALVQVESHPVLVGFIACLQHALALRLLFRRSGWNLAEMLVVTLYARALVFVVYSIPVVTWMGLTNGWGNATWAAMLVSGVLAATTACGAFGRRATVALGGMVAMGIGSILAIVVSAAIAVAMVYTNAV